MQETHPKFEKVSKHTVNEHAVAVAARKQKRCCWLELEEQPADVLSRRRVPEQRQHTQLQLERTPKEAA